MAPLSYARGKTFGSLTAIVLSAGLILSACGSGKKAATTSTQDPVAAAQARVSAATTALTKAEAGLTDAKATFCSESRTYIEDIDRYGKLFSTQAATVGDAQTAGADLAAPRSTTTAAANDVADARDDVVAAEKELADAQAALAATPGAPSSAPTTNAPKSSTTIVPQASINRIKQAESDLTAATEGITAQTPLAEATAEFNSAAFALEVAWLQLFAEAGCLTDEQQAQAVAKLRDYTVALQTELQQAGFYTGAIDGIYGPTTVEAVKKLQSDAGLPPTGLVDQATAAALAAKTELQSLTQTAALQSVLKVAGYWTGAVDGVWTPELTTALKAFQTALGVPATGAVDVATLSALEATVAKATSPTTLAPAATTTTATPTTTA